MLQTRAVTMGHHASHRLQQPLQLVQEGTFDLVAAFVTLGNRLHLLERPFPFPLVNRLAQRHRPPEVTMSQQFNLSYAQTLPGQGLDEPLDLFLTDTVYAHERPQRDHVRVDGELAAKQNGLHRLAHFRKQAATHAHPGLTPRQRFGHLGDRHVVHRKQLDDEPGLFQNGERLVLRGTYQGGNALRFLLSQGDIRHALDAQFRGAAIAFEAVQQQTPLRRVHTRKRLFDIPLRDRRQQARFGRVIPQSVCLIAEIQARSFHTFGHRDRLTEGVGSDNAEHTHEEASGRCCVVLDCCTTRR